MAECPPLGGRFITTYPARSRYRTSRLATMSAIKESASCQRLRPSNFSAKASAAGQVVRIGGRELLLGVGHQVTRENETRTTQVFGGGDPEVVQASYIFWIATRLRRSR